MAGQGHNTQAGRALGSLHCLLTVAPAYERFNCGISGAVQAMLNNLHAGGQASSGLPNEEGPSRLQAPPVVLATKNTAGVSIC